MSGTSGMSEFSAKAEDRVSPAVPGPSPRSAGPSVWRRPVVAGLPLPLLIVAVLVVAGAAWYLFGPESTPSVNQLAFREDIEESPTRGKDPALAPGMTANAGADLGPFQNEVAAIMSGVRTYAETNRTAIQTLSATVKSQGEAMTLQQQLLAAAQAQNNTLSARVAFLEGRPGAQATQATPSPQTQSVARPVAKTAARTRSALSGMRLESVQNGMAWVYWQDRTWAVKAGDLVGPVTVTRIDAQAREVHTSAGTLK